MAPHSTRTLLAEIREPLFMGGFLALLQAGVMLGVLYTVSRELSLVEILLAPFVVLTTVAIVVWVGLGRDTFRNISRQQAVQAEGILDIVAESLPHLRRGLNPQSAREVAFFIFGKLDFDAVAITDTDRILAFVGEGENHHLPGTKIKTKSTFEALATQTLQVVNNRWNIGCSYLDCPLHSAIIAPLIVRDRAVGTLKLYYARPKDMDALEEAVASGLARLLSNQLELAELDVAQEATMAAELRALQAQINPHFLFNSLNTIAMFCRTQPAEARRLVLAFADFFRHTLQSPQDFITVREELEYLDCYIELEKARFGEELVVVHEISQGVADLYIPPLTLQPLVENSVKHGKRAGRPLRVTIRAWHGDGRLNVEVEDDGAGFSADLLEAMLRDGPSQEHGIGIFNTHRRLRAFFGSDFDLILASDQKGSVVGFSLPISLCLAETEALTRSVAP